MNAGHLLLFGATAAATWFAAIWFWPRLLLYAFKRAILVKGFGDGPVPINTLYTQRQDLFADPLRPPASGSRLMSVGVNRDTLVSVGWLDLGRGPLVLRVPEMRGRYYSVQFTDPATNTVFAYVGRRTTGTAEGEFLVTGPGWIGDLPAGARRIAAPHRQVLVVGRVLVRDGGDLAAAHDLSTQIRLMPWRGR